MHLFMLSKANSSLRSRDIGSPIKMSNRDKTTFCIEATGWEEFFMYVKGVCFVFKRDTRVHKKICLSRNLSLKSFKCQWAIKQSTPRN